MKVFVFLLLPCFSPHPTPPHLTPPHPPHMTCFVVGLKKMRAEMSFKMRVVSPSETVWSSSYELFCVGGKKYLDHIWTIFALSLFSDLGEVPWGSL